MVQEQQCCKQTHHLTTARQNWARLQHHRLIKRKVHTLAGRQRSASASPPFASAHLWIGKTCGHHPQEGHKGL